MAKKERSRKKTDEIEEEDIAGEEVEEEAGELKARGKKRDRTKDSSVIYKTGEMPKLRGGGISKKLAFWISGIIAVIIGIVAVVMFLVTLNSLDKQIDADGVVASRLLAAPDYESWSQYYDLDKKHGLTPEEDERRQYNSERLKKVLQYPSLLLWAVIRKSDLVHIKRMSLMSTQVPFLKPSRPGLEVEDVQIKYGYLEMEGTNHKARSYMAPIKDHKGEITGYAEVVLSEDLIDEQKISLSLTFIILGIVFILIGIGVSFFVGKKLTVPVKALLEDITIVASGKLNHHTVPKSQDEIGLLARTFDKMTKNLSDAQSREIELAAQKHQMAVAQEVQSSLLPDQIPEVPGYEIMAFHRSSKEVDGNYYDVIQYPDGKVGVMVAAASGKGVPAAMVMTMARSFFRALRDKAEDPAEMMREANRLISPDLRAGMYVEVLMVLLNPSTHKVKLVSAGPTSLFRFNAEEKKLQGIHAEGIALGFDKGPVFDKSLKEVEFDVVTGDRLVLNTPGLFTIKNPDGVELGTKGFAKAINKHAMKNSDAFVNLVVNILDNYAGKDVDETDITFVTVKRV